LHLWHRLPRTAGMSHRSSRPRIRPFWITRSFSTVTIVVSPLKMPKWGYVTIAPRLAPGLFVLGVIEPPLKLIEDGGPEEGGIVAIYPSLG